LFKLLIRLAAHQRRFAFAHRPDHPHALDRSRPAVHSAIDRGTRRSPESIRGLGRMNTTTSSLVTPAAAAPSFGRLLLGVDAYQAYLVTILWLVMLLRFVDLQIISVLLESIKKEFVVSDTQLGLLSGLGFAIFYAALGIPIAWLADRSNRRNIIAVSLGLWSAMSALCGAAGSFATLFLARVGVGVGEAGGTAPTYALVADCFHPRRRATIFAVLNSATPAGVFVGFMIGGYMNAHYGWRAAFMTVGLPGLFVALLVWLTIREPPRGMLEHRSAAVVPEPIRASIRYLTRVPAYRHLVMGSTIFTLGAMGSGIWIASYFMRVHHMAGGTVATWLAFIFGGGGVLGSIVGGLVTDRLAGTTGDKRWYAWFPAACTAAVLPFSFFVYLWPNPIQALIAQIAVAILMHAWMGPVYGIVQGLAGVRRRAVAAAVNQLAINLIAYGFGALFVGLASDYLRPWYGEASLGYAILLVVVLAYTLAATHFFLAARTIRRDLQIAEADGSVEASGLGHTVHGRRHDLCTGPWHDSPDHQP
jgi:predicted MFS family arabinose efflux permease